MNDNMTDEKILKKLRKTCLEISNLGKDGNLQSVFSSLEILWILYRYVLSKSNNDKFVLSKGQASLGLYAVMLELGFIDYEELKTFCKYKSRFGMQIDRTKFNNNLFTASTGSLGHGLPMSVGLAMSNKINNINGIVYCLCGDGEFNEGTMWESLILAHTWQLKNLCIIIDDNNSCSKMNYMNNYFEDKLNSFGMDTLTINGHKDYALRNAFNCVEKNTSNYPIAIIAKTKRGYGCKTIMENNEWFHRSPSDDELENLINEVDEF